jgi:predicted acyl esterase
LGWYHGYPAAVYSGYERRSQYLALDDGTRLAYDLLLPAKRRLPAVEPPPVLFKYTPYLPAFTTFDAVGKLLLVDLYELKWYSQAMLRRGQC